MSSSSSSFEPVSGYDYDLIVIGGGSGGLAAAKEAGKLGAKVALFDYVDPSPRGSKWGLGGTCVNVGCIPKKLMHRAAAIHGDLTDAEFFGWTGIDHTQVKLDWNKLVHNITQYIHSTNFGYKNQLRAFQVAFYLAKAAFEDAHTVSFTRGGKVQQITGKYIVVAVGARPTLPDLPGLLECCITSDDLFSLPHEPGKTLCIGGSYVSLECAGFLTELGFDVTVMVRSILLRGFDQEVAGRIGEFMESIGTKFQYEQTPISFTKTEDGKVRVHSTGKLGERDDVYDTVLIATGRTPTTAALNLEKAGVVVDARTQKIPVTQDATNIPNIFCVGDAQLGAPELTPTAIQAGKFLSRRLFNKATAVADYSIVPTAVFTPLEYGSIGMSEEKAIEKFSKDRVVVYYSAFTPYEWSLTQRPKDSGFVKMICVVPEGHELKFREIPLPPDEVLKRRKVGEELSEEEEAKLKTDTIMATDKKEEDRGDEKVVGVHYLGPNAAEVINGWAPALALSATKKDFESVVGIHPCSSDEINLVSVMKGTRVSLQRIACCG